MSVKNEKSLIIKRESQNKYFSKELEKIIGNRSPRSSISNEKLNSFREDLSSSRVKVNLKPKMKNSLETPQPKILTKRNVNSPKLTVSQKLQTLKSLKEKPPIKLFNVPNRKSSLPKK